MPILQARRIYDFNNGEAVVLKRTAEGHCVVSQGGICSIYKSRPLTCRIYICQMGNKLSVLQENINRQGLWHLYERLGWISRADIADNPFMDAKSWEQTLLSGFDRESDAIAEDLFFYF